MELDALKNEVATLTCETAGVEFKSAADIGDRRFWPQIVRSVVAMYNSGGGAIVFGLDSVGKPVGGDLAAIRKLDPIQVSDKAKHYTDCPIPDVLCMEFEKDGAKYPGWVIPAGLIPLPFSRPGDVHTGQGKPEKLFYTGQIYVRRGAASVPMDAGDMAVMAERIRTAARKEFAEQIGQFAVVPEGHTIQVLPPGAVVTASTSNNAVRLTNDPTAPSAVVLDKFTTHPHRQRELVSRLANRIHGCRANGHDIVCIRKVFASEIEAKGYVYMPPHSSPHYADEFVDWIAGRIEDDPAFFEKTRAACKYAKRA